MEDLWVKYKEIESQLRSIEEKYKRQEIRWKKVVKELYLMRKTIREFGGIKMDERISELDEKIRNHERWLENLQSAINELMEKIEEIERRR